MYLTSFHETNTAGGVRSADFLEPQRTPTHPTSWGTPQDIYEDHRHPPLIDKRPYKLSSRLSIPPVVHPRLHLYLFICVTSLTVYDTLGLNYVRLKLVFKTDNLRPLTRSVHSIINTMRNCRHQKNFSKNVSNVSVSIFVFYRFRYRKYIVKSITCLSHPITLDRKK